MLNKNRSNILKQPYQHFKDWLSSVVVAIYAIFNVKYSNSGF